VFERALQAATDEPRVEGIVAVLDQHGAVSKPQESPAGVAKLGCADEHRTVDVMAPVGVWVDRRLTVDERVEKRERPVEAEALRADLQDEERRIASGLDVQGDELRLIEPGPGSQTR
jgi:predicted deacylase